MVKDSQIVLDTLGNYRRAFIPFIHSIHQLDLSLSTLSFFVLFMGLLPSSKFFLCWHFLEDNAMRYYAAGVTTYLEGEGIVIKTSVCKKN